MLFTRIGEAIKTVWVLGDDSDFPVGKILVLAAVILGAMAIALNGHLVTLFAFLIGIYVGENEELFSSTVKKKATTE